MRLDQLFVNFSKLSESLQEAFIRQYRERRAADLKNYLQEKVAKPSEAKKPKAKRKKKKIELTPDEMALLQKMGLKSLAK